MTGEDALGWLGFGLNVWGNWALTRQNKTGWIIRLVCNGFWIAYSAATKSWPLLANHLTFAGINVVGYRRWKKESHRDPMSY